MPAQYELSDEMSRQVIQDLHSDVARFVDVLRRAESQPTGHYQLVGSLQIEELRFIVKQMDLKVRLLGGWTS